MRAPVHRSEAPLPRSASARQCERFARARRELAEREGQLSLDFAPREPAEPPSAADFAPLEAEIVALCRVGISPGEAEMVLADARRSRPTLDEIRERPELAFD